MSESKLVAQRIEAILNDPACSDWLRGALTSALRRDTADAAMDAGILADVLNDACFAHGMEALSEHWRIRAIK